VLRYDEIMNCRVVIQKICIYTAISLILIGCGGRTNGTNPNAVQGTPVNTPDPALLSTIQAELAQTAAWASTLTPPVLSAPTQALVLAPLTTGTPLAARSGDCPAPDGYIIYERDTFCISVPDTWNVLNVDGGMAAFLNTTPGQAISIQPDWASSAAICQMMIYVTPERDVSVYLSSVRDQLATRTDLTVLSPVSELTVGDIGLYGFTYADNTGVQGTILSTLIAQNRLLRINVSGSNCVLDAMTPSLETLRVN
jgi:hypothetical protein